MITWVDVLLAAVLGVFVAAGAHRKLGGLLVGVGGALALGPLLRLGQSQPWLVVAVAVVLGLVLGVLGRRLSAPARGPEWLQHVAGGVGGAVFGLAMVAALVTSLPMQRSSRGIHYPPVTPDTALNRTLHRSALVLAGRNVVFYPLLSGSELAGASPLEHRLYSRLHAVLVPGQPWLAQ